jgi:hypothetical protein
VSDSRVVEVVVVESVERREAMAVAGFLAGYMGTTRVGYASDLRSFASWCHDAKLSLFNVRRAHLELFGRWLEESGRMRSTIGGGTSFNSCALRGIAGYFWRRQLRMMSEVHWSLAYISSPMFSTRSDSISSAPRSRATATVTEPSA